MKIEINRRSGLVGLAVLGAIGVAEYSRVATLTEAHFMAGFALARNETTKQSPDFEGAFCKGYRLILDKHFSRECRAQVGEPPFK